MSIPPASRHFLGMSLDLEVENHTCIGALFIALLAWAL